VYIKSSRYTVYSTKKSENYRLFGNDQLLKTNRSEKGLLVQISWLVMSLEIHGCPYFYICGDLNLAIVKGIVS
jgi:hypothetical protein